MAQPHARGPVDILGVTTRTNTSDTRACSSEECGIHASRILLGEAYERVARDAHTFESYHPECFVEEFGRRELYGA
jgi:hypothetical protein